MDALTDKPLTVCAPDRRVFVYKDGRFQQIKPTKKEQRKIKSFFDNSRINFSPSRDNPIKTDIGFVYTTGFWIPELSMIMSLTTNPTTLYMIDSVAGQTDLKVSVTEMCLRWDFDWVPKLELIKENAVFTDFSGKRLKFRESENGKSPVVISQKQASQFLSTVPPVIFYTIYPALPLFNDIYFQRHTDNIKIFKLILNYKYLLDRTPLCKDLCYFLYVVKSIRYIKFDVGCHEYKPLYKVLHISKEQLRLLNEGVRARYTPGNFVTGFNYTLLFLLKSQDPNSFNQSVEEMENILGDAYGFDRVLRFACKSNISVRALMDYIQANACHDMGAFLNLLISQSWPIPSKPLTLTEDKRFFTWTQSLDDFV